METKQCKALSGRRDLQRRLIGKTSQHLEKNQRFIDSKLKIDYLIFVFHGLLELSFQPTAQVLNGQPYANEELSEKRIYGTHLVKAHFVD